MRFCPAPEHGRAAAAGAGGQHPPLHPAGHHRRAVQGDPHRLSAGKALRPGLPCDSRRGRTHPFHPPCRPGKGGLSPVYNPHPGGRTAGGRRGRPLGAGGYRDKAHPPQGAGGPGATLYQSLGAGAAHPHPQAGGGTASAGGGDGALLPVRPEPPPEQHPLRRPYLRPSAPGAAGGRTGAGAYNQLPPGGPPGLHSGPLRLGGGAGALLLPGKERGAKLL